MALRTMSKQDGVGCDSVHMVMFWEIVWVPPLEGNQRPTIREAQRGNMSIYKPSWNVGSDRDLASYNMDKVGLALRDSYIVVG